MDDHSDDTKRPLSPRVEMCPGVGRKRWPEERHRSVLRACSRTRLYGHRAPPLLPATAGARLTAYAAFAPIGALRLLRLGGYSIVRAVGAGIFAADGCGAFRIAGSSRCYG